MDLINRMLASDPEARPSLADCRSHEWTRGDVLMQSDL